MAVLVSAGAFKRVPGAIRRDEKIAVLKPRRIGLKGFDLLHLADHGAHGAASSAVGLLHRLPFIAAHPIKIGRATCRERVRQYVSIPLVPNSIKKQKKKNQI